MTVKEARKEIKAKYDEFLNDLYKTYGEQIVNARTIQDLLRDEAGYAEMEMRYDGKILTNAERWHTA